MSAERSYYYLGGDALHTGIYVDTIRRLEDQGLTVGLIARLRVSPNPLATWRAWRGREFLGPNRLADIRRQLRGGVRHLPMWNLLANLSAPALARIVGLPRRDGGQVVLHARQIVMARLAISLKRRHRELRVIAEMEGDDLAEIDYKIAKLAHVTARARLRFGLERRYFDRSYREILHASDAVICVSLNLKRVLVQRYGLDERRAAALHVIPTCASQKEFAFDPAKRERTRRSLGLDDRFLVIYSGNLRGEWQVPEKLVEAFGMIRERRGTAFFLILTPETDRHRIEPHLVRAGLSPDDYRIRGCQHHEVVDHLCAGDLGLLLRERHPMNEVAAPGKFGEYTLTGLPLVMTEGIGDFSEQMRGAEWACVLPDLADRDGVRERIQSFCLRDFTVEERIAFSRWAGERFASERQIPRLAELYRTV